MDLPRFARATISAVTTLGDGGHEIACHAGAEAFHEVIGKRNTALDEAFVALLSEEDEDAYRANVSTWRERLANMKAEQLLLEQESRGGGFMIPSDPQWPAGLKDLNENEPLGLWYRGNSELLQDPDLIVALTGSRDATDFGQSTTRMLVEGLIGEGLSVITGGNYGIDTATASAALNVTTEQAGGTQLIVVLAGGVNSYEPSGNRDLLVDVARHGLIISESAPGKSATRAGQTRRDMIIAAAAGTTIVVEARWRSKALTLARSASHLGRHVGAVQGPADSSATAGSSRLVDDGVAVSVTDTESILALMRS